MGSIVRKKTKKGISYKAQVYSSGKLSSKTFPTRGEAKRWITQEEATCKELVAHSTYISHNSPSLSEAIERYTKTELNLALNGHRQRVQQMQWWLYELGDIPLSGIVRARVIELRDNLRAKYSPATTNRYLAALSSLFQHSIQRNELEKTPMGGLKLPENNQRNKYLSKEQCKRLLEEAKKSYQPLLYPYLLIAITTGARKSEIRGLKWEDVDLDNHIMMVHNTKNHESRALPIITIVREALEGIPREGVFVFKARGRRSSSAEPREEKGLDIRKSWQDVRMKANLQGFRFHDLRHTTASYLVMEGESLAIIGELLGHKHSKTTERYAHLEHTAISDAVDRVFS